MINLFYWAFGKYWYSTTVSANHSRTENIYFSSLKEMIEWEINYGYRKKEE